MGEYVFDKRSRIFLYGAGSLGSIVGKYLLDSGAQICGYIDQRAKEIFTLHGLPCYSKDEIDTVADRENDVIIVVIKDVFEHERIKETWLQAGYQRVIYKPMSVINGKGSAEEIRINSVYDLIVGQRIQIPVSVPLAEYVQPSSLNCILQEEESSYIAYIPSEIIYTNRNRSGEYNWGDINIHALVPHLSLFRLLSGDLSGNSGPYFAFCERNAEKDHVKVTEAWKENILRNRHNVYMQMQQYLSIDSGFFIRNAPEVEWNEAGYFNLKSGKHRVAFLASKKMPYIPCKISKSDFRSWERDMDKDYPESPAHIGSRDQEAEFWKEIFCALVFEICKMNLNNQIIPIHWGKSFLNLTKSGSYLERNLKKFGLQLCNENENADYVLIDCRFGNMAAKAAKKAIFQINYDDNMLESVQKNPEIVWQGVFSGRQVLLIRRKET